MYKQSINAEDYTNDTCYFMFICKIMSIYNKYTSHTHKKILSHDNLYSSTFVYFKSVNYLLVFC